MGIEPPPNIMKAGERPARVRTGAKTATKNQERDYLEKFRYLASHPEALVPEWRGDGANPFDKLRRKLLKVQRLQSSERRLRWASRGKALWNAYAATLLVEKAGKFQSFASLKFQGRDVKFVYRPGAKRESLIGVQHYDDPEVRLLGYIPFARKKRIYLISSSKGILGLRPGSEAPLDPLLEALMGVDIQLEGARSALRCPHPLPEASGYEFDVADLGWRVELCLDCLRRAGRAFSAILDPYVLSPSAKLSVKRTPKGLPWTGRSKGAEEELRSLQLEAHAHAEHEADEKYSSYTEPELATWTREEMLRRLAKREGGFLMAGDNVWLGDYESAADALGSSEFERRALRAAFRLQRPSQRVSDSGIQKILEAAWPAHGEAILRELSEGQLRESEMAEVTRLPPGEALASLARLRAARERFREILQFVDLPAQLEFVVNMIQVHRSGERGILAGKLQGGARGETTRSLALSLARAFGEQANLEWQYAPHEKDAAAFLDPFVRELVEATPPAFAQRLARLAEVLGLPPPRIRASPS